MIIPSSTYRIQFNPRFRFSDLLSLSVYFEKLNINAIYASPLLKPGKGSEHGYDGIDPTQLNPELGTIEDLRNLSSDLLKKNIYWIQDIVPNHMAFRPDNIWLSDVLERGMNSSYADYFDIDWQHPAYTGKLMAPFLEAPIETCVEENKIQLAYDVQKGFYFSYYDTHYPVCPEVYPAILSECFAADRKDIFDLANDLLQELNIGIEDWKLEKQKWLNLLNEKDTGCTIGERTGSINNDKSFLVKLLYAQHYRLCFFGESHTQINYRRFFNVNSLICLRVEDEKVFNDYHSYIHTLYKEGIIHGLRIDHIDGLKDPHMYVRRLRDLFGEDCYIIVEKILDIKEELPPTMAIQGTSGYEFLSYINQVVTDRKGSEKLLAVYKQYVPQKTDYFDIVYYNKYDNLQTYLNGEWDNLLRLMLELELIEDEEVMMADLKTALGVFLSCFPVYRVYIEDLPMQINDEQLVVEAFVRAYKRGPHLHYQLGILRQLFVPYPDKKINERRLAFVQRLMQFTGPLAAKGIEDTTFYMYNPLIAHNEVGDQPCVLGITVREFHEKMNERFRKNPISMNCTSTHDTKRGEDNRIRINIISEMADEWEKLLAEWEQMNKPLLTEINGVMAPVMNDRYFLYQAIIGAFPEDLVITDVFINRTKTYFTKVLRESKHISNHVSPNIPYEEACTDFIEKLLHPGHSFLESLLPFVKKIIHYGTVYSLVQTVIKITAPGIPDIYQGCELWDLSYVDPDNRRPVDYNKRIAMLDTINKKKIENIESLLSWTNEHYQAGAQKLYVTAVLLEFRRKYNNLFIEGEYISLHAEGSERIVLSYCRRLADKWIIIILPLGIVAHSEEELFVHLPEAAPRKWKHLFTQEEIEAGDISVKDLFEKFPVAVLESL